MNIRTQKTPGSGKQEGEVDTVRTGHRLVANYRVFAISIKNLTVENDLKWLNHRLKEVNQKV